MASNSTPPAKGNPMRSPYRGNLAGPVLLSVGRIADVGLQYALLRNGGALAAGVLGKAATLPGDYSNALMGMFAVAAARHVYWVSVTNQNDFQAGMAVAVAIFNAVFDTATTLVALWVGAGRGGALTGSPTALAGPALFGVGILLEVVSEEQRSAFKRNPRNKGKPFTKGLNSIVQHPNYFGYTLWRTGMLLTTGSYVAAAVGFAFNTFTFLTSSIPDLQGHNLRKYGDEYRQYTLRTAKLFPFVW